MINKIDENDNLKGILVIDEIPVSIAPAIFIQLLTPPEKYPSHVPAIWLKPNGDNKEISLTFTQHIFADGKQVYLYCFPEAIGHPFGKEDFEAPFETIGFLVIIDVERLLLLDQKVAKNYSAIYWARNYNLPVTIAAINAKKIERSVEKLSQLIDYSPDMPIAWCEGDIDYDSVHRIIDTIRSSIYGSE